MVVSVYICDLSRIVKKKTRNICKSLNCGKPKMHKSTVYRTVYRWKKGSMGTM